MSPRAWAATTARILRQLRHDPRTMGIVLLIPVVILTLMHYLFDERQPMVSRIELQMLVVFPIVIMFLLTAIAMVRERTSGTLERLMTTPIGRVDILLAYATAFGILASLQALVATSFAYWVLGLQIAAPIGWVMITSVICAQIGVTMGLLASAVSRSEFQAVQLFPVLLIPQFLLCGLFTPRSQMANWLEVLSNLMPMSYAMDAITELFGHDAPTTLYWQSTGIVIAFEVALLAIASATLRRRTA